MRKFLIVIFPLLQIFPQTDNQKIIQVLESNKKTIKALNDLRVRQIEAINESLKTGVDNGLSYDGKNFKIVTKTSISIYDLDEKTYKIFESQKASSIKESVYEFKNEVDPRPHPYIGTVFKLGGLLSFNKEENKISPDIMLMYEFFSFDKLFNFYGLSLNIGCGLQHVGGSLGYQFVKTKWFRNTSLHLGYSYNFIETTPRPFASISLNF
jgi:hypothetical protein